jgi:ERCC4-type nuclease
MKIPVDYRHIDSGDYVFNDMAIERKEVTDLLSSVYGELRHFWEQLKTMKATYKRCLVIIEGTFSLESKQNQGIYYSIIGGWNIPVIFTLNERGTAKEIAKLFDKYGEGSLHRIPPPVVKKERSTTEIKLSMLQCVMGIGDTVAERILDAEPLIISTACDFRYISKMLGSIKNLTPKAKRRLEKVLFNEQ